MGKEAGGERRRGYCGYLGRLLGGCAVGAVGSLMGVVEMGVCGLAGGKVRRSGCEERLECRRLSDRVEYWLWWLWW